VTRSRCAGVALLVLLATACGSTVQVRGTATQVNDGLSSGGGLTTQGPATSGPGTGQVGGATGGGTTGGSTGTTVTATAGPTQSGGANPSVGATGQRITTPIEIGYLGSTSPANVSAALGGSGGTQETPQEAFAYLVRALNAKGGLAGRQIKAVTSFIDPASGNYETLAEAACAKFTQDNHVAAVIAAEDFYYSENFSSCLSKVKVPEIQAITGGVDASTMAKYPLLYSVAAPTIERRFTAMIKGLAASGFLTPANRVGIVIEDCPYNLRAYDRVVGPALKAHGLNVTKATISCVHGFGDAAGAIVSFQNKVLPFASAGVDRVIFMSGFEGIGLQYFEQQAKQQRYTPMYALTSTANIGENNGKLPADALQRMKGIGWQPLLDSLALLPNSAATQRCRALFKGYIPAASRSNNRYNEMLCELFFSYEAMLKASNGHTDPASIQAAAAGLGTSYVSPLALTGATRYGPGRKDAPTMFAPFGYLSACQCMGYTGSPKPLA
jgi:hypothetical protein